MSSAFPAGSYGLSEQDIVELVDLLVQFHSAKCVRHNISIKVERDCKKFREVFERGQFLQILDNLFSNSFYWLINRSGRVPPGVIKITLDSKLRQLSFHDNGPGIPIERRESIFRKFVTTKPPREGRVAGVIHSSETRRRESSEPRPSKA